MWKQEGHRGEQKDRLEQNTRWILRSGLNTGVHAQRLGPSQLCMALTMACPPESPEP